MIVNVEIEVELSANEVIARLFPNAVADIDDYEIIFVSGGNTDYGRNPVQTVTVRLRKRLHEGTAI